MAEWFSEGRQDVAAGEEFAAQVVEYRGRYDTLLGTLGRLGTEVRRDRVLEVDVDIEPKRFIRQATHEFIFPPQSDVSVEPSSEVIPGTAPYTLTQEMLEAEYDDARVRGRLILTYDDAGISPTLRVRDAFEPQSELPEEVAAQLGQSVGALTG